MYQVVWRHHKQTELHYFSVQMVLLHLAGLNQQVLGIWLELWPDGTLNCNLSCTPWHSVWIQQVTSCKIQAKITDGHWRPSPQGILEIQEALHIPRSGSAMSLISWRITLKCLKKCNEEIKNPIQFKKSSSVRRKIIPGNSKYLWDAIKIAKDIKVAKLPEAMHLKTIK